ncbi:gastric triacylglycerol lipase-like [Chrysoperla carnea]|uniref:gastric triacylglycerol lipase-like n=1 Tax=Chrysoperla carnea TaxID=189513 RepID=UPI001D062470|nr:gastric triacylglycerol lipase-like [Chrysoperla carnea]
MLICCVYAVIILIGRIVGEEIVNQNVPSANSTHPEENMNVPEIITYYGYPVESHTIVTKDHYILTLHRIPYGKTKGNNKTRQPVIVQHAFLESSADFVVCGEEKSLAFILANNGYDVWLTNSRGNKYSRQNQVLSTDDKEFWDFSFDEMAKYDLTAIIDYVADITLQSGNIQYIGHSMGTTMFFALMSEQPEYNKKIKAMMALAPVAGLKYITSPISYLSPFAEYYYRMSNFLGQYKLLADGIVTQFLAKYGCEKSGLEKMCENIFFIFTGYDESQLDEKNLPVILSHSPAGTSTKTLIHFAQEVQAKGRFQHFDYGEEENLKRYGSPSPKEYNLGNVTVPVAVFYGDNDWLAAKKDVEISYNKLPNKIEIYRVPYPKFNHIDFVWAKDAPKLLYQRLLKLMRQFN